MTTFVMVNGYGVPTDIPSDGNYHKYLSEVILYLMNNNIKVVYAAGGCTNNGAQSEAEAIKEWVMTYYPDAYVCLLDDTTDARENIEAFFATITRSKIEPDDQLVIFCEYSRCRTMKFLARKLSNKYNVKRPTLYGIRFDKKSLLIGQRIKTYIKHLIIKAGWYIPAIYSLQYGLRLKKLEQLRKNNT